MIQSVVVIERTGCEKLETDDFKYKRIRGRFNYNSGGKLGKMSLYIELSIDISKYKILRRKIVRK